MKLLQICNAVLVISRRIQIQKFLRTDWLALNDGR